MAKRPSQPIRTNGRDGSEEPKNDFLVVGIGASAGGIQALSIFFENVPLDSGMAYVVILHISPSHESHLAHVLQQTTKLPVTPVTEKTKLRPDHVFVVSPDRSLSMLDGHIVVKPLNTVEERRAPVDIFFRTLAETAGPNAVGVILSGTGANGSMGLKRIKEFGGAAFAQNPREAEFNQMPRNAIATELVDAILPVSEIPSKILSYRNNRKTISIPDRQSDRPTGEETALREIFTHIRVRTGHDFSNYKRPTMLRRIERRISVKNIPDIQSYSAYLREHPDESQMLLKDLLISVTNFFRDKKAFAAIEEKIIPRLLEDRDPKRPIRIWVAGCATGEEAYSLAMIFAEHTMGDLGAPAVQVFATDIDERAIAIAREGVYTLNDAADVPPERLRRFFAKEGEHYRLRREIRELVLFAQHNLIKDPPFSHLDLISCRNLMIYLNQTAQERVLETAHFALDPGGYLFIGSSESIDGSGDLFAPYDKESHIYQSRQVTTRPLPVPESVPTYRTKTSVAGNQTAHKSQLERISYNELHLKLLEEFSPPSIVINPDYEIVHVSEHAGRYLHVVGGEPTNNLLRLVRPEIRLELRGALFQAVQQKTNVETRGLQVKFGERAETINLLIRPIMDEEDTARGYILVVFERVDDGDGDTKGAPAEYVPPEPVAQQLEEELVRSRGQLQSALEQAEVQSEELHASNEELQAMNEELRSAAEELETGKEELQSINEELTTVNQELKVKIDELSHTNNNFQNLLNSVDIGVVFLDRSLRVNLFSPAARRIFNLLPNDIGRPLSDITSRITYDNMAEDADHVITSLQPVEREVVSMDDRVFMMRIFPYRTTEDRINGVVVTFFDITERKFAEDALSEREEYLRRIAESFTDVAIISMDVAGFIQHWNPGAEAIFGYKATEIVGKLADIIFVSEDREKRIPEKERETARKKGRAMDERWHVRKDGTSFFASGVMVPLYTGKTLVGYAKIARDLTERIRGEEALRDRALLQRLVGAQEDERQRIARDLHDQLGQQLTALRLKLEGLKANYGDEPAMMKAIDETQGLAKMVDDEVSFMTWELRPTALDKLGLKNALGNFVREWSKNYAIEAEFHSARIRNSRLASDIEINLYRIAQEALNNVVKHARASKVDVMLEFGKDVVVLIVEDNGHGFDLKAAERRASKANRLGLVGMRERATLLGGTLQIESARLKGTTVMARIPARVQGDKAPSRRKNKK